MDRLVELTHRAVPYPVVLVTEAAKPTSLSLVHKRGSEAEADRVVLDGEVVTARPYLTDDMAITDCVPRLLGHRASAAGIAPRACTRGGSTRSSPLKAAAHTGVFRPAPTAEAASARRDALQECTSIEAEMTSLRAAATKTKQVARRAKINLELQRLKSAPQRS
jgi:hypothetical protein